MHPNMANKILFIGVGSAGSKVVDKAMKDYPELFESVAIGGHPIGGAETSWPYINLLHDRCEPTGFMNHKRNVQEVMEENMDVIKEMFKLYLEK